VTKAKLHLNNFIPHEQNPSNIKGDKLNNYETGPHPLLESPPKVLCLSNINQRPVLNILGICLGNGVTINKLWNSSL
jgi:hypothetical protein